MKIRLGDLKRLIYEEAGLAALKENDDSLDDQVDQYLSQFEKEAKSSKREGLDFRMITRRLLEAEDDEEKPAELPNLTLEDIDLNSFVNSVVRLIENYDSLLEVRNTLARRARNFLSKLYAPDVVETFDKMLRDEHGIIPGKSEGEVEAEKFIAPRADRAGEGGGAAGAV